MTIRELFILAVYVLGVITAFYQIRIWNKRDNEENELPIVFISSMVSWFIYPIYALRWIIHKSIGE